MDSEELGRVLSLISHEIRAPLGVMRGYMRLLEQQGLTPPQQQVVNAAAKAGDRATEILDQLSTLATLHRGETPLIRDVVPLEPLLRHATTLVRVPPARNVSFHISDVADVVLRADRDRLASAFATLVQALVQAEPGDARIFLTARLVSDGTARRVFVSIATREARTPAEDERPLDVLRGGLGLELPIAAFIVVAHHGTIAERRDANRFVGATIVLPAGEDAHDR
jgi:signal transduction histidine kinase